jgi:hypothetical protein
METCYSNARLSIYRMGDAHAFVIKGDAPAFVIKGDVPAFMMGDRIGDTLAFVIKGDASRETRVSFTCIIRDT